MPGPAPSASCRSVALLSWSPADRKSTRLNSSHTVIYTLSLHDALPICRGAVLRLSKPVAKVDAGASTQRELPVGGLVVVVASRSEEHTSELQSHRDLHSFPTRRSSDLPGRCIATLETSSES